jgi:hypothetical protein
MLNKTAEFAEKPGLNFFCAEVLGFFPFSEKCYKIVIRGNNFSMLTGCCAHENAGLYNFIKLTNIDY